MANVRIDVEEITCHFHELEDPRSSVNQKHPFVSVVVIAIMAIISGSNGPTSVAEWAEYKKTFLLRVLDLPNGIPRKDVFRRVLCLLNPAAFQACFTSWLTSLRDAAAKANGLTQPIFAVEGKTLRRSHDRAKGLGALHSVRIWARESGLSLGPVACAEKSKEITAIPERLRLVDIQGAIITIDAMGTQKAIAAEIIKPGADYVLALKGNQETLHDAVIAYLDQHNEDDFAGLDVRRHTTTETGHGRHEVRNDIHRPVPSDLPGLTWWKGLASIGVAISIVTRGGKESLEMRYFLSSLPVGVKRFAHAVRSHWGIENGCHGTLDRTFREDESRIRQTQFRQNFAWLNRLGLSLMKQHPSKKSIAGKRRGCGWDETFLLEVLMGKGS